MQNTRIKLTMNLKVVKFKQKDMNFNYKISKSGSWND